MFRLTASLALIVLIATFSMAHVYPDDWVFPSEGDYVRGVAVIEFSESMGTPHVESVDGIARLDIPELDALAVEFGVCKIEKANNEQKPDNPMLVDLSRWYFLHFPEEVSVEQVVDAYMELSKVDWIEPKPVHRVDYIPNDPLFYNSWHLIKIECPQAWDFTHGSASVPIAIIDSGTDIDHSDLESALWVNPGEDLNGNGIIEWEEWNGIDDDGNGYPDDFWGWDFIDYDNWIDDSYPGSDGHGTHCAGDASAATDNANGVSGTGFDCSIMTLRCGYGGFVQEAWNGLIYAGNNDAAVISCSFGSDWHSAYEQSLYTTAWQQGSVICASAGNDGNNYTPHYPSMYDHVISVGATTQNDAKAYFSNYSYSYGDDRVDVMAPGVSIYTTTIGGGYGGPLWSGTSMAAPIAAGVTALIRSVAPQLTPAQVETVLCVSCDNIDPQNPSFIGLLGYGRVNAYNAVTMLMPNLSVSEITVDDDGNNDGRADPGENCDLIVTLYNGPDGQPANNLTGEISCDDPDVTISQDQSSFGNIPVSSFGDNSSNPFEFSVSATAVPHWASFTLALETSSWAGELEFELELGRPPILVVDDDNGENYETYYSVSLNALDLFHDIWDESQAVITADELLRYDVVIWETGTETSDQLTVDEQAALQVYLDCAKNLMISSQNLGEEIGGTPFYTDYLHAQHEIDDVNNFFVDGIEGDPISGGTNLILIGTIGAGNSDSPSAISPLGCAEAVYTYQGVTDIGAIKCDFDYQIVYFAFPFEAISGMANTTSRDTIMNNVLNWFDSSPPPPDLVVTLTPENPPIQIPAAGGSFDFNLHIQNNSATQTYVEDLWIDVTLPNGTIYGPIVSRLDLSFPPGANPSRDLTQSIPAGAPTGDYTFWAHIGEQASGAITVEDSFPFTKLGDDGSGFMSDWITMGWDDFQVNPGENVPSEYLLAQNSPNPFNPETNLTFSLPKAGNVELVVYDIQGRQVAALVSGYRTAGVHQATFDGSQLSSGVYFASLKVNDFSQTRKMLLVK